MKQKYLFALLIWGASLIGPARVHASFLSESACAGGQCNNVSSGLASISTGDLNALGQAWAEDFGTLKAYAEIDGTDPVAGNYVSVFGTATAVDRLYFPGLTSGTADFTFDLSGTTSLALQDGRMEVYLDAGNNPNSGTHYVLFRENAGEGACANCPDVPMQNQLTVSFDFGSFLDTDFAFSAFILCGGDPRHACNGSATADFLDTLKLTQIQVFDSNGNLVDNPVINSDSGFDYSALAGPQPSAVPEPALWIPMLLGCAAVCLFRRKMKQSVM